MLKAFQGEILFKKFLITYSFYPFLNIFCQKEHYQSYLPVASEIVWAIKLQLKSELDNKVVLKFKIYGFTRKFIGITFNDTINEKPLGSNFKIPLKHLLFKKLLFQSDSLKYARSALK